MREGRYFAVVLAVLFTGFGIGFCAGLSEPEPVKHPPSWETLLAGLAAIIGGWMAYSGAVAPLEVARKVARDRFHYDFERACKEYLDTLDPKTNGRIMGMILAGVQIGGPENPVSTRAGKALDDLPVIPESIGHRWIIEERDQIVADLNKVRDGQCEHDFPVQVRNKIIQYLRNIAAS